MKHVKRLADYEEEAIQDYQEEWFNRVIQPEEYQKEKEYLVKHENCNIEDIRLFFVAACDEVVIYVNEKFYGYLDSSFLVSMDYYNNEMPRKY